MRNVSSKILCYKIFAFTRTFTRFSELVPRDRDPNTKMRTCLRNQKDAAQMPSDTLKAKTLPERVPRRCAAAAAHKIKRMSKPQEAISGPENVWIRKGSRKLPHRDASAAAKKKTADCV